jgi:hypothetical protein
MQASRSDMSSFLRALPITSKDMGGGLNGNAVTCSPPLRPGGRKSDRVADALVWLLALALLAADFAACWAALHRFWQS